MNMVTMKEANQNFSRVCKLVDETGSAVITKHGKEKYIIMTIKEYKGENAFAAKKKQEAEKGLWIDVTKQARKNMQKFGHDDKGKTLYRIKTNGAESTILQMHFFKGDDEPEFASEIHLPTANISYLDGDVLEVRVENKMEFKYAGAYMDQPADSSWEKRVLESVSEAMEELKTEPNIEEAIVTGPSVIEP